MSFYKQALDLEKQTSEYYQSLNQRCSDEGIKNILNMLARDHQKHQNIFKEMINSNCSEQPSGKTYQKIVEIFKQIKAKKTQFNCNQKQIELYKHGLDLIRKKLDFYQDGFKNIDCEKDKNILKQIIEEEQKQVYVFEDIIEMVNRTETWIENAEFYHFEEY